MVFLSIGKYSRYSKACHKIIINPMPKVSVIVPVYNVEKFIRRCLISIQQQSLDDIEIIVVNDATPDNSMAIVQELAKDDHRITILNHEKNLGPMCTRETGYMAAIGDYITFCDSDDYMPKDALEKLYSTAVASNADIVSGNSIYLTVKGEKDSPAVILHSGGTSGTPKSIILSNGNINVVPNQAHIALPDINDLPTPAPQSYPPSRISFHRRPFR